MKIGDLVRHKDYPQSLAVIIKTWGKPSPITNNPPTIQVAWCKAPSGYVSDWTDTFGSVWLEVVNV